MALDDVSQLMPTSLRILNTVLPPRGLRAKILTADKCASRIPNTMNQILSIEGEKKIKSGEETIQKKG